MWMPCPRACAGVTVIVCSALLAGSVALGAPLAAPRPVGPDGRVEVRVSRLVDVDDIEFSELLKLGFLLERTAEGDVIAWLSAQEMTKLEALGIDWIELPQPARPSASDELGIDALTYHDYDGLSAELQQIASDHPEITRLVSAGRSAQGRELWWLRISDNPDLEEDEPGFKYISTMHGDEPVGTEMCLQLIHLLTDGYGSDPRATRLVDEVEIWIMPMMNPDGNALNQRTNAQGIDLNRDFPDVWDDPVNTPAGRAVETGRVMEWQFDHTTSLSANFHTGEIVVNYPFDNNENGQSVYTACPDDDVAYDISIEYSEDNLPMYNGPFTNGVTNGAAWYAISGGMQDWNYNYAGDLEVTIELNRTKRPPASELEALWNDNRESMLSYLERVLTGVRGVVSDAGSGSPVAARLAIVGRDHEFATDPEVGDFQRTLLAGSYELLVEADGYEPRRVPFTIVEAEADATRVDVLLTPRSTSLAYLSHRLDSDAGGDGYLDPGESGRIAVTLENLGEAATGITGRLRPLSAHSEATGTGEWPDLGPGASGESLPPHCAVSAGVAAPAGHRLAYAVDWSTAEGLLGTTRAFFVPLGAPDVAQHPATDAPRPIRDHEETLSTLTVGEDDEIAEVNAFVDISHTYRGDLSVVLVGPDGTECRLHDRGGGSQDDILTWYDTQTPSVDDLAVFTGKPTLGTWSLRVTDHANGDEGALNAWTLELITRPFEDPVSEVLLRSVSKTESGTVRLEWWPVGSADAYRVYRSDDPASEEAYDDVTSSDPDPTDTRFDDGTSGSLLSWIVAAEGHTGEGLWGHFGR